MRGDLRQLELALDFEIFRFFVFVGELDAVALAQEAADLLLHLGHRFGSGRLNVDAAQADVDPFPADQPLHGRRDGDNDRIILVVASGRFAFGFEHANHAEGNVLKSEGFADGTLFTKEFLRRHRAKHGDGSANAHVLIAGC